MMGINFVFRIVYNFAHKNQDRRSAGAQINGNLSFAVWKAAERLAGGDRRNLKLV